MKTQNRRIFSGVAGTMLLFSGAGLALHATNPRAADASGAPPGTTHARDGLPAGSFTHPNPPPQREG